MANSKSNIYPIQLQGAELNLNKLDAEIKQYSGFNKNNSPFVGGCLSNLFEKKEVISGSDGDNVYIDSNGDVYEVKTDGVYKNNTNKVIPFEEGISGDESFVVEELDLPSETVYCYDEKLYVTKSFEKDEGYDVYVIHFKNANGDWLEKTTSMKFVYTVPNLQQWFQKSGEILFDAKKINDNYFLCVKKYHSYNQMETSPRAVVTASAFYMNETISNDLLNDIQGPIGPTNEEFFYITDPCVYANVSENKFYVIVNSTINNGSLFDYDINSGVITQHVSTSISITLPDDTFVSNGFSNLTSCFCKCLQSENDNEAGVCYQLLGSTISSIGNTAKNLAIVCNFKCEEGVVKLTVKQHVNVKGNSIEFYIRPAHTVNGEFIFKNWGAVYCLAIKRKENTFDRNNPYANVFGVSDLITNCVTSHPVYDDKVGYGFDIGTTCSGCILINNNIVSGISLPGGKKLITEWNSVNQDFIFLRDNTENNFSCIYKSYANDRFYHIKKVQKSPRLFKIGNQIITNINQDLNSYNTVDNRLQNYASAWNNRIINLQIYINVNATGDLRTEANHYYLATSINEHRLEENPSILFNPIATINRFTVIGAGNEYQYDGVTSRGVDLTIHGDVVNIYQAYDTTMRYSCSIFLKDARELEPFLVDANNNVTKIIWAFIDESISDQVFPLDTNGNIALSPSLNAKYFSTFGNDVFVVEGDDSYQLSKSNNQLILSYYLGTLVTGLEKVFILQGQYYGIINNMIFSIGFNNGVVSSQTSIVSVENLQFVGNTPYEALFFSKTNRCLYSFTGANVLNQKQLVDKISEVRNYLYNPATQTVFLITDIGVLFYGLFGMFLLEYTNITNIFLLDNGIVMSDNSGNYRYIKYYLDEGDTDYTKENIRLETCFYGMNNEVVTINDCLYFRLFSEEHEEGNLKVSATTISLSGRKTEETTFKIKASDWDKITHTIYLRYQPKTQRGLGVSFSIDSPFKIASMSVGSQPDAVLVDKVSKGAITAPSVTTNNNEW